MERKAAVEEECGEAGTMRFLREAMPDFEICARRAVECILAVPTYIPKGFTLSPVMNSSTSFTCFIQAGNSEYSATLSLGLNQTDLEELMPGVSDGDMLMDTVGEITNVIAGSFLGRKSFQEPFGSMLPSPPLFSKGGTMVQKSWCIHGVLKANGVKIFLDFMIKSAKKDAST